MKKTRALIMILCMVFALIAGSISAFAAEEAATADKETAAHDSEWDTAVPTEITEKMQAMFEQAMEGLLGVDYEPVAVLGQKEDVYCFLCKATTVYPGAKPYNVLIYINNASEKAEVQNIYDLWIDAHSEKKTAEEAPDVEIDYGTSKLYTEQEMDEAVVQIREEFDSWKGCELHSLQYAGDECNTKENVDWLNSLGDGHEFVECIEFVSEFHSPVEGGGAWEADEEYTGWQWWLGRSEGGSWELVNWGY